VNRNVVPIEAVPAQLSPLDAWGLAVLFFGIGDVVTTVIGSQLSGVVELSPVLSQFDGPALYVAMVVFIVCFLLSTQLPSPHSLGAPITLAALGFVVTLWNLTVLTSVLA
jgi:hypothetical protein